MDDLGIAFAPTQDAAANGPHNGALTGVPAAIRVISLHLPRILGVRSISPLVAGSNGPGAAGTDPLAGSLMTAILKTIGGGRSLPADLETGASPTMYRPVPTPRPPMPSPAEDPYPSAPSKPPAPQIHTMPVPGGTAGPGPGAMLPRGPFGGRTRQA